MKIVFRNMARSELVSTVIKERFAHVLDKFPDLRRSEITLTLSMHNAPTQAGPDLFSVKLVCLGGRFRNLVLEKSSPNLYAAWADLLDHLLERLNRFGDRERVRHRALARKHRVKAPTLLEEENYIA